VPERKYLYLTNLLCNYAALYPLSIETKGSILIEYLSEDLDIHRYTEEDIVSILQEGADSVKDFIIHFEWKDNNGHVGERTSDSCLAFPVQQLLSFRCPISTLIAHYCTQTTASLPSRSSISNAHAVLVVKNVIYLFDRKTRNWKDLLLAVDVMLVTFMGAQGEMLVTITKPGTLQIWDTNTLALLFQQEHFIILDHRQLVGLTLIQMDNKIVLCQSMGNSCGITEYQFTGLECLPFDLRELTGHSLEKVFSYSVRPPGIGEIRGVLDNFLVFEVLLPPQDKMDQQLEYRWWLVDNTNKQARLSKDDVQDIQALVLGIETKEITLVIL
jgi:hypothetical protein